MIVAATVLAWAIWAVLSVPMVWMMVDLGNATAPHLPPRWFRRILAAGLLSLWFGYGAIAVAAVFLAWRHR